MKGSHVIGGIVLAVLCSSSLYAQTFLSGSTGADGALDLTSGAQAVQLPESGILNFTTVNVPEGRTLRFLRNAANTPVVMLAQGNVTVSGVIDVSARSEAPNGTRTPGPGGFAGGLTGGDGFGPGGGHYAGPIFFGRWVGPLTLVPIVGGSGGSGHCGGVDTSGGGGGAIVIASSSSITITGHVQANGGFSSCGSNVATSRGAGSGGAIRLLANSLVVSGVLQAYSPVNGSQAAGGVVRLEAPPGALSFTGSSTPPAVLSPINPAIAPTATPRLTLASIAGFPIPSGSGARPDTVDLLLPTQLVDPIPLIVEASNIPVGSQVTLAFNGAPGTAAAATLAGTELSSTATLNISGLNRSQISFLFASVTFEVPNLTQSGNPAGPDHIAKLRIDAIPGRESRVAFLRRDGTEVALNLVPQSIRQQYGQ